MPGGCTVIERTIGRRFRCRYAAMTEVSTGVSGFVPLITARHCRYRAFGLVIDVPSACVYADDQLLHVSSGVSVLPDRVKSSTRVPDGFVVRQLIVPHVATVCASRASDSYVPRVARSDVKRNSLPGLAVA